MGYLKYIALFTILGAAQAASKDGKVLSFFNVVRFPNDVCMGSNSRNGTCYTAEECEDRGGTKEGDCADGFGVCCIITLSCGDMTSENCTYLVQESTTTPDTSNCNYRICPMNSNICRIRLHFTTFVLSGPSTLTGTGTGVNGGTLGDCVTDTFVATSGGGGRGSPVICGTNTGHHMFVDTNGKDCVNVGVVYGTDSNTRQYDIKVEQFACNSEMGGPMGCLQYFTATKGTITSFNYNGATYGSTSSHLSNQNYKICFRRVSGYCTICYTATSSTSFGVSVSTVKAKEDIAIGSNCATDFLLVPEGNAIAANVNSNNVAQEDSRICGRLFGATNAATTGETVCTRSFDVDFVTNDSEVNQNKAEENINELQGTTKGTLGFSLGFEQMKCA